ncbi:hypothetical protein ACLB1Q_32735 [Escherichia coli]
MLPNLTLQFALGCNGKTRSGVNVACTIQLVEGAHAAAWQPTRLC